MSLMFMGDVHGERGAMKPFLESDCKTLIQLGDFGFVWKYNDIKYNKYSSDHFPVMVEALLK